MRHQHTLNYCCTFVNTSQCLKGTRFHASVWGTKSEAGLILTLCCRKNKVPPQNLVGGGCERMTGPQYKPRSQFSVQTSTERLRMAWIKIALLLFISVEAFGENRIKYDIDDQLQVKQKKKRQLMIYLIFLRLQVRLQLSVMLQMYKQQ